MIIRAGSAIGIPKICNNFKENFQTDCISVKFGKILMEGKLFGREKILESF